MPRKPRIQAAGAIQHVTMRGNRRARLFLDDEDFVFFLQLFGIEVDRQGWVCFFYCLMPNHVHLVFETPLPNLSAGMQRLNSRYAQAFNQRYELTGHVYQGRFHSVLVESTEHLLWLIPYLALNPVSAGLVSSPAEWRWSSYAATLGIVPPTAFLALDRVVPIFGATAAMARRSLERFVADTQTLLRP